MARPSQRTPQLYFFFLFLCLAVSTTRANFEWLPPHTICESKHSYTPEPYTGVPPPMPNLPNQYSMTVHANILEKSWNSMVEEYYDGVNQRSTVYLTFNGSTTQTIFNHRKNERYDIYPNTTCTTRPRKMDMYGFMSSDRNNRPMMSTVYEMFQMGNGILNASYVGHTWVRGIKVNHWSSCKEWKTMGAKFQVDYYYSHNDYQGAWGKGQIPVRVVVNGSAGNMHDPSKPRHRFDHIYDFTSMKIGRIANKKVFFIPTGVVCGGRTDTKPMPDLPNNFQMNMEITCPMTGSSIPMQQSLNYDWEHRLVETVRQVPSPQGHHEEIKKQVMQGETTLKDVMSLANMVMRTFSMVDDHNTGLRYITEKSNNTCKVVRLPAESTANPMANGPALLNIHRDQKDGTSPFVYQGRSQFRGLPVDVWGVDAGGMVQKVMFLASKRFRKPGGASGSNPNSPRPTWMPQGQGGWSGRPTRGPYGNNGANSGGQQGTGGNRPGQGWSNGRPQGNNNNGGGGNRPGQGWSNGRPQGNNNGGGGNRPGQGWSNGRPQGNNNNGGGGNRPWANQGGQNRPQSGNDTGRKPWNGQAGQSGLANMANFQSSNFNPTKKPMNPMMSQSMEHMNKGKTPFPVMVGMVFRNRTAIDTRNMPALFKEIITSNVMKWANQNNDDDEDLSDPNQDLLDNVSSAEDIHDTIMKHAGEMDMHVFNFQPLHTDESMFQVSHCYQPEETSQIMLHIPTSYSESVRRNRGPFSIALRKSVADAMGVSSLQISRINPGPYMDKEKKLDSTRVTFSLLGRPPITGAGKRQLSISQAKQRLARAILNGISFKVKYATHTKSFLVDREHYSMDYVMKDQPNTVIQNGEAVSSSSQHDQDSSDSGSDYSPGAVVGIAIATTAVGALLATIVMAFLYKRKHPEEPVVPYKISKA